MLVKDQEQTNLVNTSSYGTSKRGSSVESNGFEATFVEQRSFFLPIETKVNDYEDEYHEDDERNQLISHQDPRAAPAGAPGASVRGVMREQLGPMSTFAGVVLGRLGLAGRQTRSATSSETSLTNDRSAGPSQRELRKIGAATGGAGKLPSPLASERSQSYLKPTLLILLCLLLIACSIAVLVKLNSLVEVHEPAKPMRPHDEPERPSFRDEATGQMNEGDRKQLDIEQLSRWLVASSKCHIPVLDPWHDSIRAYVRKKAPLNCSRVLEEHRTEARKSGKSNNSTTSWLSYVTDNKLHFTNEAINLGALSGRCCYKRISRSIENDFELEYAPECVPIRANGLAINQTLIQVNCLAPLDYVNVHSFVAPDVEEEAGLERTSKANLREADYYNVLMVGVDTMSRLNAQRQLEKTLDVLMGELYETLDFTGYNKVGENTFPNLIPLLTGLRPSQLAEVQCWLAKNYTDEGERADDFLDDCKYLWNYYQMIGYSTYYSEDWPAASTFNYLKPGFRKEPTTYYGRPYALARDQLAFPKFESIGCQSCQLDKPIVKVDLEHLETFIERHQKRPYFAFHWINCPQHDDLNGASQVDEILGDFFKRMQPITKQDRTFVIFFSDHGYRWNDFVSTRIGHYESSLPLLTIAAPKLFIEKHPNLYERLKAHQNALLTPFDLFKTLIAIKNLSSLGRDGSSVAQSAEPKQRPKRQPVMPLFANSIVPQPFAVPMDVALSSTPIAAKSAAIQPVVSEPTTGADTAGSANNPAGRLAEASIGEMKLADGVSLKQQFKTLSLLDYHSRDELDRSCTEAGIPDNYCVCHQFRPIPVDRADSLGAAYYLVYAHLAARLANHLNICHQLDLDQVHQVEMFDFGLLAQKQEQNRRRRFAPGESKIGEARMTRQPSSVRANQIGSDKSGPKREYSIMFSTKPGGALFQEVVRFNGANITQCEQAVASSRHIIDDKRASFDERRLSVETMNSVCEFSVNSDSISRFNLYKDQSKCVKSNIELKKICYCNDLL